MAKRITYRATFSDGTEATRQSHRTYHYAWLAVVPYRERDRETGEYVEPFLWWRHSGFSNTYEGAEAEGRRGRRSVAATDSRLARGPMSEALGAAAGLDEQARW